MIFLDLLEDIFKDNNSFNMNKISYKKKNDLHYFKNSSVKKSLLDKNASLAENLPNDYLKILSYADGMILGEYNRISGIQLFGLNEIIKETNHAASIFDTEMKEIYIIGNFLGEDTYIGIRKHENSYEILDCWYETAPYSWKVIGNNLDEFLVECIRNDYEKFWL